MIPAIRVVFAFIAFLAAAVFALFGILGMFRYHDPYNRLQAGSLCGTTAAFSAFIGAAILAPSLAMLPRLAIIMAFFLVSSPTSTHIVARFAWDSGIEPTRPRPPRRGLFRGKVKPGGKAR